MGRDALIGIDLGGTSAKAALVLGSQLIKRVSTPINAAGSEAEVLQSIFQLIERLGTESVEAVGVGVPSVVDIEAGIIYDTVNIPAWKEVPLKRILQERFRLPAQVDNDSNCFALGEKQFGKAQPYRNAACVTLGTGMGTGLIIENRLYSGANCGAGEFGMIPFRDQFVEYYASGQFFKNVYATTGEAVARRAQAGDEEALRIFQEFGANLGTALTFILYAVDPEIIVLGGSISRSYAYFEAGMRMAMNAFIYRKTLERIKIETSDNPDIALLGAAGLCRERPQVQEPA